MTATDELRRILDERSVEWSAPDSRLHDVKTRWAANGFDYTALEDPSGKAVDLIADYQEGPITPEQAIEATLGRGTCEPVDGYDDDGEEIGTCCSECGSPWPVYYVVHYCPVCGAKVVDE